MKNYLRLMLGKMSAHAEACRKGGFVALEGDLRLRRALAMVPDITSYRYEVSFKLVQQT